MVKKKIPSFNQEKQKKSLLLHIYQNDHVHCIINQLLICLMHFCDVTFFSRNSKKMGKRCLQNHLCMSGDFFEYFTTYSFLTDVEFVL